MKPLPLAIGFFLAGFMTQIPTKAGSQELLTEEELILRTGVQTTLSPNEVQVMDQLISIAIRNSPTVEETKANASLQTFLADSMDFYYELAGGTDYTEDFRLGTYKYYDIYIDLFDILNGIRNIDQKNAKIGDAERQTRKAVVEAYIDFMNKQQAVKDAKASLQAAEEAVKISESQESQITKTIADLKPAQASSQAALLAIGSDSLLLFDSQPSSSVSSAPLVTQETTIEDPKIALRDAVITLRSANMDALLSLENLSVTVGLTPSQTLEIIEGEP